MRQKGEVRSRKKFSADFSAGESRLLHQRNRPAGFRQQQSGRSSARSAANNQGVERRRSHKTRPLIRCAIKQWLNSPACRSINRQSPLAGHSADSSFLAKPARTLSLASCRLTSLQPMNRSNAAAQSETLTRCGSHARKNPVCWAACHRSLWRSSSEKWCRNKLAMVTSLGSGSGRRSQSNTSISRVSTCQESASNSALVRVLSNRWRSTSTTRSGFQRGAMRFASRSRRVPSPAPSSTRDRGDRSLKAPASARTMIWACPIQEFTLCRSRRDRTARRSPAGNSSSSSRFTSRIIRWIFASHPAKRNGLNLGLPYGGSQPPSYSTCSYCSRPGWKIYTRPACCFVRSDSIADARPTWSLPDCIVMC